jgi:ABC-type multidrug transport system fused ATPase/permease subunit
MNQPALYAVRNTFPQPFLCVLTDGHASQIEELKLLSSINENEPTQMFSDAQTCYKVVSQTVPSSIATMRWWQLVWIVAKVSFSLRPKIVLSMISIAILSSIFRILSPKALQMLIDTVASTDASSSLDYRSLLICGIIFAASHWAFSVLEVLLSRISQCFAFWLEDVWHTAAIHHALTLPMSFHHRNDSGALASKLERGASEIGRICMSLLGDDVIISSFTVISSIWMAIQVAPESWWIFIVPLPIYVTATHFFEKKSQLHFLAYRPLSEIVDTTRADAFRSIATVKLFGRERKETLKMTHVFTMMRMKEISGEVMYFTKRTIEEFVEMFAKVALIAFCLPRLQDGSITIGQLALLLSLQSSCFTPLDRVNNCIVDTGIAVRKIRPLITLLATEDALKDSSSAVDLPTAVERVELKNVSFRYDSHKKAPVEPMFNGIDLEIRKGMTAIVGRSGAGKSTLASLLLRFYDPESGRILWNAIDLKESTKSSRHKQIAVVPQGTLAHSCPVLSLCLPSIFPLQTPLFSIDLSKKTLDSVDLIAQSRTLSKQRKLRTPTISS